MNSKTAGYTQCHLFTPNPQDPPHRSQQPIDFSVGCILFKKKQVGPTRLFFCIPAVKTSEFIERRPVFLNPSGKNQRIHRTHPYSIVVQYTALITRRADSSIQSLYLKWAVKTDFCSIELMFDTRRSSVHS